MGTKRANSFICYASCMISIVLISIVGCTENRGVKKGEIVDGITVNYPESDILFGEADAPLNIVFFANYECQFCRKFFKDDLELLLNQFKGKVKLSLKIIPSSRSESELDAIKMALSISKYGNFNAYHSLLLREKKIVYSVSFQDYLNEVMQLNQAIAEYYYSDAVSKDLKKNVDLYNNLGIKGTPAFIINNKVLTGYKTYKELNKIIEQLINN